MTLGKIMRRLPDDIAEGRALGDTATLADPSVVSRLETECEAREGQAEKHLAQRHRGPEKDRRTLPGPLCLRAR